MLIVITDGRSHEPIDEMARSLRADGVKVMNGYWLLLIVFDWDVFNFYFIRVNKLCIFNIKYMLRLKITSWSLLAA